ncbi:MAG: hypothetical protein ACPGSM_09765 [Thiolinea sp.]
MKHLFIQSMVFSAGVLTAVSGYAGSANADFKCKSASGRTVLQASVPGDHAEHLLTFTIDGEAVEWKDVIAQQSPFKSDKNSSVFVLGSMKTKNYHFLITAPDSDNAGSKQVFRFSAIPSSINVKQTANGERGRLSAVVAGQDPRANKGGQVSPEIVVDCTYTYEI